MSARRPRASSPCLLFLSDPPAHDGWAEDCLWVSPTIDSICRRPAILGNETKRGIKGKEIKSHACGEESYTPEIILPQASIFLIELERKQDPFQYMYLSPDRAPTVFEPVG